MNRQSRRHYLHRRADRSTGFIFGDLVHGSLRLFRRFFQLLYYMLVPLVAFGQNAEILDKGNTSCACAGIVYYLLCHFACPSIYACTYRSKLRGLYSISGDQCADFCIHCCCPLCAICQEHRELKNRGLDPSIGWVANAERQNVQIGLAVAPAVQPGMTRT